MPSPANPSGAERSVLPDTIDHVAFATRDLDRAQDRLAALGLSHTPVAEARWPTEDGPHRARSLCVVLLDGYLDLIERPAAPEAITPTGVVLACSDLARTREQLMAAGIRCGRPYTVVRRFEGAGPDQRYAIFGIDARHASGLPQSLIWTEPAPPLENRAPHSASVTRLTGAARLLGVELDAPAPRATPGPGP